MKKGLFLLLVICMGMFVSGCTTKNKLYCTKVETSETETTMQEITVHFKDGVVKDMTLDINKKLNTVDKSSLDGIYNSLVSTMDAYKDKDGYTITSKKTDDTARVTLFVEPSKIVLEDQTSILDLSATKESLMTSYKEQGFTCE